VDFNILRTTGNKNEYFTEQKQNLQLRLNYCMSSIASVVSVVQDDRGWWLRAVRSIKLVVRNFRRKSSNFFLSNFVGYSLMSIRAENLLHSRRF